jgi:hypothetical protein
MGDAELHYRAFQAVGVVYYPVSVLGKHPQESVGKGQRIAKPVGHDNDKNAYSMVDKNYCSV